MLASLGTGEKTPLLIKILFTNPGLHSWLIAGAVGATACAVCARGLTAGAKLWKKKPTPASITTSVNAAIIDISPLSRGRNPLRCMLQSSHVAGAERCPMWKKFFLLFL